jgi:hypothetical protein
VAEKVVKGRKRTLAEYSGRRLVASLLGLGLVGTGIWFAVHYALTTGLERLPDKMCEGTLEQSMVKEVLPKARSADSGSDTDGAGYKLSFRCHVTTSGDSTLSGEARVQPVSREQWLEHYRGAGGQNRVIRVSAGDVEAVARMDPDADTTSVYVPCVPPGVPSYNASQPYAVVGETRVDGAAGATGVPLRQALTDFAYQLSAHAYKLAECEGTRDFPAELPRYRER